MKNFNQEIGPKCLVNSLAGNSAILHHSCYNATFIILPLTFCLLVKFPEAVYKERFPKTFISHYTTIIANILDTEKLCSS